MSPTDSSSLTNETLRFILATAQDIAHEHDVEGLCKVLLDAALELTNAEGGTLYLSQTNGSQQHLKHSLFINHKLNISTNAFASESDIPHIPLYDNGIPDSTNASSYSYHNNCTVNIPDIYRYSEQDFTGTYLFDRDHNYTTESILCIPISHHKHDGVLGVFQLINARDEQNQLTSFSSTDEIAMSIFADFAASALDRQILIDQQRNLLVELSAEPNTQALIERILREAKHFANADAGTLYLVKGQDQSKTLSFEFLINDSLNLDSSKRPEILPDNQVSLFTRDGEPNLNNVASASVHLKQTIVIEDAYRDKNYDFSGTKSFDQQFDYRSQSFLVEPLLNHDGDVIGVLQLINAKTTQDGITTGFSDRSIQLITALANYAAIGLNNQLLVKDLKELLDAFIRCIAKAIDAKSPHTSAHCQRIPLLTEMIAQAACEDTGTFRDFHLNEDDWYELSVASWLHDCGKLATPDSVLDKSTKLHLMSDRIELIKARFSSKRAQLERDHYKQLLNNPEFTDDLKIKLDNSLSQLDEDLAFLVTCNKGGEYMAPEKQDRIKQLATQSWIDANGNPQPLLDDDEVYNLCIAKGTLTNEERQIINDHMVVTVDMLESLPFPEKLKRVPEYACGHHERMDGTGFPKGLTREQLSIPARMMAIADVFEALTASERPYKDPMKIGTALKIMNNMVADQHLDPDIFKLFVEKEVWKRYAILELKPEQMDINQPPEFSH
ncbi:MAG: hypothetical protein AseanaTS_26950 [Candidatus Pelagadaptatus aseana]|uniref:HD domain-containing phosphohydrolase n=1 Tax=Candidatus Pelagadaptatus aseana TaxID=3120508 RepID=UPI0039B275EF